MLEIDGLRQSYEGADVLDIDHLVVPDGAFVSVVGPSGCGKSTLLRIVAGVAEPTAGSVRLDGAPLPSTPGHAGFMPQHDRLLPWRNVRDNAVLAADIHGVDRSASRARADALLDRFGLTGYATSWPRELSGGMRQRLALLRTFLTDRDLLLLDEPFGALDAITRRRMHGWLQEVLALDRRTVVFVTHDVEEALLLSDRVLVLSPRPGRIVGEVVVDDPRPRTPQVTTEPAFVRRKADVFSLLESFEP